MSASENDKDFQQLKNCTLCPRECNVNRFESASGICATGAAFSIASVCLHKGEEPPVSGPSGICNIFFTGCNLRCVYCQNHEISQSCNSLSGKDYELNELLDMIGHFMTNGVRSLGFVTPSHVLPQVKAIISGLHARGLNPITVYNTSAYDKAVNLRALDGLIDVYLPDIKYVSSDLAARYSGAGDYPVVALRALKEMYWQKGSVLSTGDDGLAESGMIIRHLVLPGHADESIKVLETIASELSPGVSLSLMSQYHPAWKANHYAELGRQVSREEYSRVARAMERLGFRNGWLQDPDSSFNYRPDFGKEHPFEN